MDYCQHIFTTGKQCEAPVWKKGEPYCIVHDIWFFLKQRYGLTDEHAADFDRTVEQAVLINLLKGDQ